MFKYLKKYDLRDICVIWNVDPFIKLTWPMTCYGKIVQAEGGGTQFHTRVSVIITVQWLPDLLGGGEGGTEGP